MKGWSNRRVNARDPVPQRKPPLPAHGKTRAQIHDIVIAQRGCAICKRARHGGRGWHGDHDHKTGLFRGVLCSSCNTGIGMFRDSPRIMYAAIHYLEQHAMLHGRKTGKAFKIKPRAQSAFEQAVDNIAYDMSTP